MHSLDWGSVPEWLGGLSLILAFAVFRRDRTKAERTQVEHLGVWAEPAYSREPPLPESADLNISIRNASDLPMSVDVVQCEVVTEWCIPYTDRSATIVPGGGAQGGTPWPQRPLVKPGETIVDQAPIFVLNHAPAGAESLASVNVMIQRIDVTDNAGRRWRIRPKHGNPIRRVRFYHLFISPPFPGHTWYRSFYYYPRHIIKHPKSVIRHIRTNRQRRKREFIHAPEYLKWLDEIDQASKSIEINNTPVGDDGTSKGAG